MIEKQSHSKNPTCQFAKNPPCQFTLEQLTYLKDVNDLLYYVVYEKDPFNRTALESKVETFKKMVSEKELLKIYSKQIVESIVSPFPKESTEETQEIVKSAIINYFAYMRTNIKQGIRINTSLWVKRYEKSKELLTVVHQHLIDEHCQYFDSLVQFKEYNKLNVHPQPKFFNLTELNQLEFSYDVDTFYMHNANLSISTDFILSMIHYFNGGHRAEIEIALKHLYDKQTEYETPGTNTYKLHGKSARFIYHPHNLYLNSSYKVRLESDFIDKVFSFFNVGISDFTYDALCQLREAVQLVELREQDTERVFKKS